MSPAEPAATLILLLRKIMAAMTPSQESVHNARTGPDPTGAAARISGKTPSKGPIEESRAVTLDPPIGLGVDRSRIRGKCLLSRDDDGVRRRQIRCHRRHFQ